MTLAKASSTAKVTLWHDSSDKPQIALTSPTALRAIDKKRGSLGTTSFKWKSILGCLIATLEHCLPPAMLNRGMLPILPDDTLRAYWEFY
jgi:hypothetical protein